MALRTVGATLIALLASCGGRSPLSGDGPGPSDAAMAVDGAKGGSGGVSTGGSGGTPGGGGGQGGATGGAGPQLDAATPTDGGGDAATVACGSCGVTPCPVRPGQPQVLVTSPLDQQIMAIAVSEDTLYYATLPNQTLGEIRAMPLDGGPSRVIASDLIVTSLYLQGPTLYAISGSRSAPSTTLLAMSTTGDSPRIIATGNELRDLTFDASGIYFSDYDPVARTSRLLHGDANGGAPATVLGLAGVLSGFAIDDKDIYWAEYASGSRLRRRPVAGGDATTLLASPESITSPLVDRTDVVYVEGTSTPATCRSRVMAVAKEGGASRRISPGASGIDVMKLARDDTRLYWASNNPHGAVLRTRTGDGPEILATEQANCRALALNSKSVFWIVASSTYEVRTLPK